jgi:hypothetical protein
MKTETALNHFKTNPPGLAKMLGLDSSTVRKWDGVVPLGHAALLNKKTAGKLRINWTLYDERGKPRKGAG